MSAGGTARSLVATVRPLLPGRGDYRGLRRSWGRDLAAGVTVGIVALPLALAFGVATGVGSAPGLITAVVAGAVAAVFGGSHLQVSGPTGAMTVVLVPLVGQFGPSVIYPVALLAGIVVVVAAVLRLGRLLAYGSWPTSPGRWWRASRSGSPSSSPPSRSPARWACPGPTWRTPPAPPWSPSAGSPSTRSGRCSGCSRCRSC